MRWDAVKLCWFYIVGNYVVPCQPDFSLDENTSSTVEQKTWYAEKISWWHKKATEMLTKLKVDPLWFLCVSKCCRNMMKAIAEAFFLVRIICYLIRSGAFRCQLNCEEDKNDPLRVYAFWRLADNPVSPVCIHYAILLFILPHRNNREAYSNLFICILYGQHVDAMLTLPHASIPLGNHLYLSSPCFNT